MAFISLLLALLIVVVIVWMVLSIGMALIIVGTILYNKKEHKKLGIVLRIFGCIALIPSITIIVLTVIDMFYRS